MCPPCPTLKPTLLVWALSLALATSSALAQAPKSAEKKDGAAKQPPAAPLKETIATDIPGVIKGGTKIVLIRDGFKATEGIIAHPDGSSVIFTEQDADKLIKVDQNGNITTFLENTNRTTGLTYDTKGRLIGAQSRDPKIGVLSPEPRTVLADSFNGQPLVRPNDLIADKKGGIYFSDPLGAPAARFREPPAGRTPLLLYVTPAGKVVKPTEDVLNPNGIELTADEKILYVTNGTNIMVYDVQPDGMLKNGREFCKGGGDGLAIDTEGRLYSAVAGLKAIRVNDKTGKELGLIPIGVPPQSVGFAGPGKKTLYINGAGALYKVEMIAQGIQVRAK